MSDKRWTITVQEDPQTGDAFIELPDEALSAAGLECGDTIKWTDNGDGSWSITKAVPTKWVLVECVSTFRMRYMVELKENEPGEWACDSVIMNDAVEFSQKHLDETIVSHRVIDRIEAIKLCREDNDYISSWPDDQVVETFFTPLKAGDSK